MISFYAWIGNALFFGSEEGLTYFSSLVESMYTLWICVTTANYPDVMMLAYNRNRISNIFFISFMVIAYYLLMNVVLATVVNSYNNSNIEYQKKRLESVNTKMMNAYSLLDPHGVGWIEKEDVMAVFTVLNEDCPEVRYVITYFL